MLYKSLYIALGSNHEYFNSNDVFNNNFDQQCPDTYPFLVRKGCFKNTVLNYGPNSSQIIEIPIPTAKYDSQAWTLQYWLKIQFTPSTKTNILSHVRADNSQNIGFQMFVNSNSFNFQLDNSLNHQFQTALFTYDWTKFRLQHRGSESDKLKLKMRVGTDDSKSSEILLTRNVGLIYSPTNDFASKFILGDSSVSPGPSLKFAGFRCFMRYVKEKEANNLQNFFKYNDSSLLFSLPFVNGAKQSIVPYKILDSVSNHWIFDGDNQISQFVNDSVLTYPIQYEKFSSSNTLTQAKYTNIPSPFVKGMTLQFAFNVESQATSSSPICLIERSNHFKFCYTLSERKIQVQHIVQTPGAQQSMKSITFSSFSITLNQWNYLHLTIPQDHKNPYLCDLLNETQQTVNQGQDLLAKPQNNFEQFRLTNQVVIRISRIILTRNGLGPTKKIHHQGSYMTVIYYDAREYSSSIQYDSSIANFMRFQYLGSDIQNVSNKRSHGSAQSFITFVGNQPEFKLESSPQTMRFHFYFKTELKIARILQFKSFANIRINSNNKLSFVDLAQPNQGSDSQMLVEADKWYLLIWSQGSSNVTIQMEQSSYVASNISKSQRKSNWRTSIFTLGDNSARLKLSTRFIRFYDSHKIQSKYIQNGSLPDISNDNSLLAYVSFENDPMSGNIRESANLSNISIITQSEEYVVNNIDNYEQIICLQSEIKISSYCSSRKRALPVKKQFTKKLQTNQFTISSLPLTIQCWIKVSQIINDATFVNIQNLFRLQGLVFKTSNPFQSHFALQTNEVAFSKQTNITQPLNQWLYYTYEKASNHSSIYINQNRLDNKTIVESPSSIVNTRLSLIYSSLQSGIHQTVSSFEGIFAGLAIYQQVATTNMMNSRLPGIKLTQSLLFYHHFAEFQTEKTQQSPAISFQNMDRYKLIEAADLMLAPYDAYQSDDANVYIQKCQSGYFYKSADKKCVLCPQNCQFCVSESLCTKCKSSFYQASTQHQGVYTCKKCQYRCLQCYGGTNSECHTCRFQKLNNKCDCLNFFVFNPEKIRCQVQIQSQDQTLKAINEIDVQNDPVGSSKIVSQLDQQLLQVITTSSNNSCSCQNQGACDQIKKQCTCPQGYTGQYCQYSDTVYNSIVKLKSQAINSLERQLNEGTISTQETIQAATNMFKLPDTINQASYDKTFDIINQLKKKNVGIEQVAGLFSVTTKSAIYLSNSYPKSVNKLVNTINSVIQESLSKLQQGATLLVTTQNLQIAIKKSNKIDGLDIGRLKIQSFSFQIPDGSISLIQYKENIYKNLDKSQEITTQLQQANLYSGSSAINFNTSKKNSFILKFDITQDVQIYKLAQQLYSGQPNATEASRRKQQYFKQFLPPECYYWDEVSSTWRKDGCIFYDLLQNEILCKCNHFTFFGSFFKTGVEVLLGANIGVLFQAWDKTLKAIVISYGFYGIAAFWVLFFILKIFIDKCDNNLRKRMSIQLILEDLGQEGVQQLSGQNKSMEKSQFQQKSLQRMKKNFGSQVVKSISFSQKRQSSLVQQEFYEINQNDMNKRIMQKQSSDGEYSQESKHEKSLAVHPQHKDSINNMIEIQTSRSQSDSKNIKVNNPEQKNLPTIVYKEPSKLRNSIMRLKKKYEHQLKRKKCCLWCRLCKKEVQNNNLLFNAFARTSIIYMRSTRFTLFWVSILTSLFCEALFFDMSGAEDSGSFWDNVIGNIWFEIWSMMITIPLMMIIGFLLRLPHNQMMELKNHSDAYFIKRAAKNLRRKYMSRQNLGFAFMYFLLILESIYFICFFAIARQEVILLWLDASLFIILLDMVLFEIIAGVVVASMVQLSFSCKCTCALVVVFIIGILRNLKSLTD